MRNLKNILPVLVFAVTLVLAGVSVLTSHELAKRKQVTPDKIFAESCPDPPTAANCHWFDSTQGDNATWQKQTDPLTGEERWFSDAEAPDPSARETDECVSGNTTCGSCSVTTCGTGTRTCSNNCDSWSEGCSVVCSPTPTNTITPTKSLTPTNTPTQTLTPTKTPTQTLTPTKTPTLTPTNTPTGTLIPTVSPTNTLTPTNTPTGTLTPSATPTNTPTNTPTPTSPPNTYRHRVCEDNNSRCVERNCSPNDRPCSDTCQIDADCVPIAVVTPVTPKAATFEPTVLTILGGAGLFILGIILTIL